MGDFLDKLDKVPFSQKVVLLLLLVAGLFVAYYLSLFSPLDENIKNEESRFRALQNEKVDLMGIAQEEEILRAQIAELCSRRESFLEKLPAADEIPSLLQNIHQQAMLVGMEIFSFTRQDDVPEPNYTRIPVAMEVRGSYDQVADFFYFIGRQQRIVNVSNIRMQVIQERNPWRVTEQTTGERARFMEDPARIEPPRLQVSCQVATYFTSGSNSGGAAICAAQE
jgi:type IV pilus assembly protein PilO